MINVRVSSVMVNPTLLIEFLGQNRWPWATTTAAAACSTPTRSPPGPARRTLSPGHHRADGRASGRLSPGSAPAGRGRAGRRPCLSRRPRPSRQPVGGRDALGEPALPLRLGLPGDMERHLRHGRVSGGVLQRVHGRLAGPELHRCHRRGSKRPAKAWTRWLRGCKRGWSSRWA